MENNFSKLEINILKSKGLSDDNISSIIDAGIACKADFATVGDAKTLSDITAISESEAAEVMIWAGVIVKESAAIAAQPAAPANIIVDSPDTVKCFHCDEKQPRDYSSGDLCSACGRQAEPVQTCYWCASSGPGKFCRSCGATHVDIMEFDIALLLKHEGVAKGDIAKRIADMDDADKATHMGRVNAMRARR